MFGSVSATAIAPIDAERHLAVGDRLPGRAAVRRPEQPAAGHAHVERPRLRRHAGDRRHAAAARGADQAIPQSLEPRGVDAGQAGRGFGAGRDGARRRLRQRLREEERKRNAHQERHREESEGHERHTSHSHELRRSIRSVRLQPDRPRMASTISAVSGKRPAACFENSSLPSTRTSNAPRSPRSRSAVTPNLSDNAAARLEARGR